VSGVPHHETYADPVLVARYRELVASGRYVPFEELRASVALVVASRRRARVASGRACEVPGCTRLARAYCDEPIGDWTCNLRLCNVHRHGHHDAGRDRCPEHRGTTERRRERDRQNYARRLERRAAAQAAQ
jgi:hypothetical protein